MRHTNQNMQHKILRLLHLDPFDDRLIRDYARMRGWPPDSTSAAVRGILHEWFALRMQAETEHWPQIVPPWDLKTEIQRIKTYLHGYKPPSDAPAAFQSPKPEDPKPPLQGAAGKRKIPNPKSED
jgi:hypothetical protein